MAIEVIAFKCEFCSRVFRRRQDAAAHEKACKYNPKRRNCHTCAWFDNHGFMEIAVGGGKTATLNCKMCLKFLMPLNQKPYYEDCDYKLVDNHEEKIPGTCNEYTQKGKRYDKD